MKHAVDKLNLERCKIKNERGIKRVAVGKASHDVTPSQVNETIILEEPVSLEE